MFWLPRLCYKTPIYGGSSLISWEQTLGAISELQGLSPQQVGWIKDNSQVSTLDSLPHLTFKNPPLESIKEDKPFSAQNLDISVYLASLCLGYGNLRLTTQPEANTKQDLAQIMFVQLQRLKER